MEAEYALQYPIHKTECHLQTDTEPISLKQDTNYKKSSVAFTQVDNTLISSFIYK